jgi:hypothetical protein
MYGIAMLALLLFFAGLQTPSVSASEPARNESVSILNRASKLLNSSKAAERAWGAYLAGQNNLTVLKPKLEKLLEETDKSHIFKKTDKSESNECLVRSILDAEIKMGAILPENTLKEIWGSYPNEATILLARAPRKYVKTILSYFTEQGICFRWLALGNLLLESKEPGFFLALMKDMMVIRVMAFVRDKEEGRGGSGGSGAYTLTVPASFPPVAVYEISTSSSYATHIIKNSQNAIQPIPDFSSFKGPLNVIHTFKGPHNAYATRWIIHPGESGMISHNSYFFVGAWDPNPYRLDYLSSFLKLPKDDITFSKVFDVSWRNPKQFTEDMGLHCSRILKKYDHMVALLRDKNLITPSEADMLKSSISLEIYDRRRDITVALPDISQNRVIVKLKIRDLSGQ